MSENLTVAKDVVVGLAYTLYVENAVEDSAPASAPLEYIHGHGNLISGLEAALEGLKVGDKKNVTVEPEDAYGDYDPENVLFIFRERTCIDRLPLRYSPQKHCSIWQE